MKRDPWWRRAWRAGGERALPWNAAFATLAIATLVTVLWHAQEVPTSRVDPPSPSPVAQAPTPSVAAPAGAGNSVVAKNPAPPQAGSQPALAQEGTRPAATAKPKAAVPGRDVPAPSRDAGVPAPAVAPPPPAAAQESRSDAAPMAEPAPPPPAAPAPSAAAPAAQSAANRAELASAAPAARRQAQFQREPGVTRLQVTAGGSRYELAPGSRANQLVSQFAAEARDVEPLEAEVEARIEVTRDGQPPGVLDIAGAQVRWTHAGATFTGRPDPARLQALRDELSRGR